jgi:hypothetical protein
MKRTS